MMSFKELFQSGKQVNKVEHFRALVGLAQVDGQVNPEEEKVLKRLAQKLDLDQEDYLEILKQKGITFEAHSYKLKQRLEYLYDLFKVVYADHYLNEAEQRLLNKYAVQLGFSEESAKEVVEKSIRIFGGEIDFEDYHLLLSR